MKREFYDNLLCGGYTIFIRGLSNMNDSELMNLFGIAKTELLTNDNNLDFFNYDRPKVYLTENNDWKHIMDNWSYSLQHRIFSLSRNKNEDVISKLGEEFEIMEAFVSDVDDCFGFRYYSEGILERSYSIQPLKGSYSKNFVAIDYGNKRKMELEVLKRKGIFNKLKGIYNIYNIKFEQKIENIRCLKIME